MNNLHIITTGAAFQMMLLPFHCSDDPEHNCADNPVKCSELSDYQQQIQEVLYKAAMKWSRPIIPNENHCFRSEPELNLN